jgi:heme/copper-type cytochrome/quinol oxidase subunit 3
VSEPIDIPYASAQPQEAADAGHLKALVICYYVWGPLLMLFSCFFIIYIVMGVMMLRGTFPGQQTPNPPPPGVGWILVAMGSIAIALGWGVGILTIISGRAMAKRRWRMFTMVMAGVNCACFPLGTLLGVFTFGVLLRPSVKQLYRV